jgi:predicted RNase H-like HicB family nuclease
VRFQATVEASADGGYVASCEDPLCTSHGLSPTNALDALREEIRYRLELCPCTGVKDDFVELDVVSGL